jgi:hypothetical protein
MSQPHESRPTDRELAADLRLRVTCTWLGIVAVTLDSGGKPGPVSVGVLLFHVALTLGVRWWYCRRPSP